MQDTKDKAGAYPVDYSKVGLTKGDPLTDFSLSGYVRDHRDYAFSAKVYDRASEFGIDNGRVSKLTVWRRGEEVMNYSRGWDIPPSAPEHREVLGRILAAFPQPTVQQYRELKRAQRELFAARDAMKSDQLITARDPPPCPEEWKKYEPAFRMWAAMRVGVDLAQSKLSHDEWKEQHIAITKWADVQVRKGRLPPWAEMDDKEDQFTEYYQALRKFHHDRNRHDDDLKPAISRPVLRVPPVRDSDRER